MLEILSLIAAALFNLLTWIAVALCLVIGLCLALWYGMRVMDKVHAILWQRRIKRALAAQGAYTGARDRVMGNYAPRKNPYVRLRYNEFHLESSPLGDRGSRGQG